MSFPTRRSPPLSPGARPKRDTHSHPGRAPLCEDGPATPPPLATQRKHRFPGGNPERRHPPLPTTGRTTPAGNAPPAADAQSGSGRPFVSGASQIIASPST